MEHIVQFGINIDDDVIKKAIESTSTKQIENTVIKEVLNKILTSDRWAEKEPVKINTYDGKISVSDSARLSEFVVSIVEKIMEENKELLLDLAAEKLAESFKRTKVWKERATIAISEVRDD